MNLNIFSPKNKIKLIIFYLFNLFNSVAHFTNIDCCVRVSVALNECISHCA